jgi:hypothetical protein
LCRLYLRNQRVPASDVTPEELVSEIWQKLLGLGKTNGQTELLVAPDKWSIEPYALEHDGRVVWLIEQIGGRQAMAHRHEDILRQRYGRSLPEGGRRIVQPGIEDESSGIDSDDGGALTDADAKLVWRGLLITAGLDFQPHEDVWKLLRLMSGDPDILDAWSGEQWPIKKIVASLNLRFPPPPWTDRRVENAKRRLERWISSLKKKYGLVDTIDLEALFALVARQYEGKEPG